MLFCQRKIAQAKRAFQAALWRIMAFRVVMIFRMTARIATFVFFPAAARRSWKALSEGLYRQAHRGRLTAPGGLAACVRR